MFAGCWDSRLSLACICPETKGSHSQFDVLKGFTDFNQLLGELGGNFYAFFKSFFENAQQAGKFVSDLEKNSLPATKIIMAMGKAEKFFAENNIDFKTGIQQTVEDLNRYAQAGDKIDAEKLLIAVATAYANAWGYKSVVIGANADDNAGYPDCRLSFIRYMDDAARAGYGVGVWAPLARRTKRQVIAYGRQLGIPFELTWSCYRGGAEQCGRCGACESNGVTA